MGLFNQSLSSIYVQKRQNGGRNSQRALRVPFSFQWADFAGGGGGGEQVISGRLVKRFGSGFEKDKNYCVELLAIYLRRMII